ncbi:hypothetical protein BY458DRAFT_441810 [Sporodiniella umbellata]|nr:hypothetical protein BY458DRAFT_441810 [Sporodiniella umbellata]
MSSPIHSQLNKYDAGEDLLGFDSDSRYSKRFKSLVTDTPPRDTTLQTSVLRTPERIPDRISTNYPSPLRRNVIPDRYKTVEIENEDRGQWRESSTKQETETTKIQVEEKIVTETEINYTQASSSEEKLEKKKSKSGRIPHYMQGTRSFESRLNSKRDDQRQRHLLSPRLGGGITKRVGTSRIPKYKSTTSINAMDDIKNEMGSDDGYVSTASRIKLYEKGMKGNTKQQTGSHSSEPSSQELGRKPSTSISRPRTSSSSTPSYARSTESAINRSNAIQKGETSSQENDDKPKKELKKQVKPFRFATSERAQHHKETFNEKLKLWKIKEQQQNNENQQKAGLKRKVDVKIVWVLTDLL